MIKKFLFYFVLITISLVLQSTFLSLGLIAPDLVLLLVVAISINMQSLVGLLFCFLLGLCIDFSSGVYLGPYAAAYIGVFSFLASVSKRLFADRIFAILALTFIASILKSIIINLFLYYFVNKEFIFSLIETALVEAVFTSLFSSVLIFFLNFSKNKSLTLSRASR